LRPKIVTSDESKGLQDNREPNGRYANYFTVGYNAFEFLFDFGQIHAEDRSLLHTRIITTPVYAKTFLGLLQESIDQYEQLCGTIPSGDK
jgi:hypothetical protein